MTTTDAGWSPFDPANAIGDPGRQPEIRCVSSDLNVGTADTALDFLSLGALELRACSTRGWSHRYKGNPRQDAYSILVGEDALVIAVADGVSEGPHSHVAADTAARATVKLAAAEMAKNGVVDWELLARRVSLRIVEEAEYRQIASTSEHAADINERVRLVRLKMSTTLIAAVLRRSPTHLGIQVEVSVIAGDSGAFRMLGGSMVLTRVSGGKELGGLIASTSVKPLPGPTSPDVATIQLQPGDLLLLATDGLGDPLGDGTNDFSRELALRWGTPPTADRFMSDIDVYRRSFDDDRTAVAVWVRPELVLPDSPPVDLPVESDPAAIGGSVEQADQGVVGNAVTSIAAKPTPAQVVVPAVAGGEDEDADSDAGARSGDLSDQPDSVSPGGSAKGTDDIVAVIDVVREARSFRQDIEGAEVNEGPSDAANPTT